jgi:hypothetical protein
MSLSGTPGTPGTPGVPGIRGMPRSVQPEILDHLAPEDPEAQRSRRDLRRVNRFMGACGIISRALRPTAARASGAAPLRLLELGSGDGELMLRVARTLALRAGPSNAAPHVALWLLDRQALVRAQTLEAYARVGWHAQPLVCDVCDWAAATGGATPPAPADLPRYDLIVTNLFLHHFAAPALRTLLAGVAARCERFLACEPRRSAPALLASHLLGAIGANRVTRHDAVLSVQAGFRDHEISDQWPDPGWQLEERAAGLFSHLFVAWRNRADTL